MKLQVAALALVTSVFVVCQPATPGDASSDTSFENHENVLIDLWTEGFATFGVYVPNENPPTSEQRQNRERPTPVYTKAGGEALAQNPLYDFVFLNLEGNYDVNAVEAIADGLRTSTAAGRKTLLVRIPPIERDGPDAARTRVKEIIALGADGVVLPHIRSPEDAELAVSFFTEAGVDVWSPANPSGEKIAMIMVEDPDALASLTEIANTPGYSILACGIGSLTRAFNGDREAAEAENQAVLEHAKRVGVADMITANSEDIVHRVQEGFLALLMQGPTADDVIRLGRATAGR